LIDEMALVAAGLEGIGDSVDGRGCVWTGVASRPGDGSSESATLPQITATARLDARSSEIAAAAGSLEIAERSKMIGDLTIELLRRRPDLRGVRLDLTRPAIPRAVRSLESRLANGQEKQSKS